MDLFEAFPQLEHVTLPALKGRHLRLISVSGLVYDERAFYLEPSGQEFWGRLPDGQVSIGIGAAKVLPNPGQSPYRALSAQLRRAWHCEVGLVPVGHTYLLLEDQSLAVLSTVAAELPFMFLFTPPRLAGAQVPDALVQAVYLLPVERWLRPPSQLPLLQVERQALVDFLAPEDWLVEDLVQQPWARLSRQLRIPDRARARPVLAVRALRGLAEQGILQMSLPLVLGLGAKST